MAIDIQETFEVEAPVETVWQFLLDPEKVVLCLPGAELSEIVDERTFLGVVKVKLGAVTSKYKGKIEFTEVDPEAHRVQMVAQGRDASGGTAKGTISSQLRSIENGRTEVTADASIELTGRVMQVGRGMIQGVSQQLFQQFVASAKQRLESPAAGAAEGAGGPAAAPGAEDRAIRLLPILWKTAREAIGRLLRRIFGRSSG